MLFANAFASMKILRELKKSGTTTSMKKSVVTFDQFNEIVNLKKFKNLEKRYVAKRKKR